MTDSVKPRIVARTSHACASPPPESVRSLSELSANFSISATFSAAMSSRKSFVRTEIAAGVWNREAFIRVPERVLAAR